MLITKLIMAKHCTCALYKMKKLPDADHPEVKKYMKQTKECLQEQYELALKVIDHNRKEGWYD